MGDGQVIDHRRVDIQMIEGVEGQIGRWIDDRPIDGWMVEDRLSPSCYR